MSKKTLVALVAVLVLGGVYAALTYWPQKGPDLQWSIAALKDKTDKLEIAREGTTIVLEKRGEGWQMTAPLDFPASKSVVDGVLDLFESEVGVDLRMPVKEDELATYDLHTEKAIGIKASGGGAVLADLLVGKAVGKRTFVKPTDDMTVYRAKASIRFKVDKAPAEWRNKDVLGFDRDDAIKLVLHHSEADGGPVTLEREVGPAKEGEAGPTYGEGWTIAGATPEPADKSTVSSLLGSLANMRAADFADDVPIGDAGFAPDSFRVTVHLKEGKGEPQSVVFGATVGEERFEGKYKDDFFAMREGVDTVYVVRKYTRTNADKQLDELRTKEVFPSLKREQITSLTLEAGGETVKFEKDGDKWKAVAPADLAEQLDESPLNSLLSSLAGLRAARVLGRVDDTVGGFVADQRKARVTIGRSEGDPLVLLVGGLADEEKKEWHARLENQPTPIWVLRDYVVRQMTKGSSGFRKKDSA